MKKSVNILPKNVYAMLPAFLGFIFVFIAVLPIRLPLVDTAIGPFIVLTIIYHTAVKYPSLLPPIGVFILGLLYDMLSAGPLGYWALIYLCTYLLSRGQKYLVGKEKLLASWSAFVFVAILSGILSWGLGSIFYGHIAPYKETLTGVLTACLCYPLVYTILIPVDRRFDLSRLQGFGRA